MTIKFTEGFELVTTIADLLAGGWSIVEGTGISATESNWGGQAWNIGSTSNNTIAVALQPVLDEEYVNIAQWRKWSSIPNAGGAIIAMADAVPSANPPSTTSAHFSLGHQANGAIQLFTGGIGRVTLLNVIKANTWMHFEMRVFMDNTVGTVELWVDGIKLLDLTGMDTRDSGASKSVHFTATIDPTNCFIDDVVIHEGTSIQPRIGLHRIHTLFPDGNGTNTAWTGTSTDVDDPAGASDGDSTFAVSNTLNAKQDYTLGNLSVSPATIKAVVLKAEARKTDAGVVGMTQFVISNAVTGNGTEFPTTETYGSKADIFELNPDGAVAWTEATVNAVQIGHEITTV